MLAYEALHALSMAVLNDREVRTDGEGHRSTALQIGVECLTQGSGPTGIAEMVVRIHRVRNETTYVKPVPPITKALADATLKVLDAALAGVPAAIRLGVEDRPPPTP